MIQLKTKKLSIFSKRNFTYFYRDPIINYTNMYYLLNNTNLENLRISLSKILTNLHSSNSSIRV